MGQELTHFGIKGMHWGVRRFQNDDGTLTSAGKKRYSTDRKTRLTESVASKKNHVEAMRKQAGERIEFYGGKNTAMIAIQQEANYKKKVTTAKTITAGTLIATGAAYATAVATQSIPVVGLSTVAIAAGTAFTTSRKNKKISAIAEEQIAYTKDSDYGSDVVVRKTRD